MKQRVLDYLKNDKHLWWTVTVVPGLYSILYLYTNNYTLVNSWYQLMGFILMFIALPVIEIIVLDLAFKKWLPQHRAKLYWAYLIINFAIILSLCVYLGWRWKGLILVAVIAIATSFFASKHYKKLVLLVSLMTIFGCIYFCSFYVERVMFNQDWTTPQKFENLTFKKKPNIYLIQPDGFVAMKTAANSRYKWKNLNYYNQLESIGFKINYDYRSNYTSTLTSNSTLFTGQHHFYDKGKMNGELLNARDIIMGENNVLRTLKKNGYQLNAVLEHSYLLLNFPNVAYDHINVDKNEIKILPDYLLGKDVEKDFQDAMLAQNTRKQPQFFFVEILQPGHIPESQPDKTMVDMDRLNYFKSLENVTVILDNMIKLIHVKDPEAIIIVAADHGGYIGFEETSEAFEKTVDDIELKQSIFNPLLAIKAPEDFTPYQDNIKTTVGVFNNIFHYLAALPVPQDTVDNSSYIFIKKGDARGIYKYYNTDGKPVTQKIQL